MIYDHHLNICLQSAFILTWVMHSPPSYWEKNEIVRDLHITYCNLNLAKVWKSTNNLKYEPFVYEWMCFRMLRFSFSSFILLQFTHNWSMHVYVYKYVYLLCNHHDHLLHKLVIDQIIFFVYQNRFRAVKHVHFSLLQFEYIYSQFLICLVLLKRSTHNYLLFISFYIGGNVSHRYANS